MTPTRQNSIRRSSILMIYTGGTIGMKEDPVDQTLKPFDFDQILREVPNSKNSPSKSTLAPSTPHRLFRCGAGVVAGACHPHPRPIRQLRRICRAARNRHHVLFRLRPEFHAGESLQAGHLHRQPAPHRRAPHGREGKPVSAVEIASTKDAEGHALVPEVAIFFDSRLMRGNRTTKVNAENFNAFDSRISRTSRKRASASSITPQPSGSRHGGICPCRSARPSIPGSRS